MSTEPESLTSAEVSVAEDNARALIEEIRDDFEAGSDGGKALTSAERKRIGAKALKLVGVLLIDLID